MTKDPQNDSKSLGRNMFAETKAPLGTKEEENNKVKKQLSPKEKSLGRNMFPESAKTQSSAGGNNEFEIIDGTSLNKNTNIALQ